MGPNGDFNFRADRPAVAYNPTNNEYLVVWEGNENPAGYEVEIHGQRLNAATGAEVGANDFRISDMGPDGDGRFSAIEAAVAYNSTDNEYLVVWGASDPTVEENEIFGQRLDAATGTEVGTNDFRISDMGPDGDPNFDGSTPAVAYNPTNNEYLVTWYGNDNISPGLGELEIYGQRLNAATGAELGANDFRISNMG